MQKAGVIGVLLSTFVRLWQVPDESPLFFIRLIQNQIYRLNATLFQSVLIMLSSLWIVFWLAS